jgi:hypothetical protein
MSDLDKGAALMHVWKRNREGGVYARENYPAEYIEHPDLIGLPRDAACHHATAVAGRNDDARRVEFPVERRLPTPRARDERPDHAGIRPSNDHHRNRGMTRRTPCKPMINTGRMR